jgi:hypothetical protein
MLRAFLPTAVGATFSFAFDFVFPVDFVAASRFLALTWAADFVVGGRASISFDGEGAGDATIANDNWQMAR